MGKRTEIDRKLLSKTFHSWVQAQDKLAPMYGKCGESCHQMIDDVFEKMPTVHHYSFQGYYFQRGTGWAKKTVASERRMMLELGFRFLAEYGRGRIPLGKKYDPIQILQKSTGQGITPPA